MCQKLHDRVIHGYFRGAVFYQAKNKINLKNLKSFGLSYLEETLCKDHVNVGRLLTL